MVDQAVKDVCALFAQRWAEANPRDRMTLYRDVQLFMRFYSQTSRTYRNTLLNDLNPLPQGELVNPHVFEHVPEPDRYADVLKRFRDGV